MTVTSTNPSWFVHTLPFGWLGDLHWLFTWVISILLLWWLWSKSIWQKSCSIYWGKHTKNGISQGSGYWIGKFTGLLLIYHINLFMWWNKYVRLGALTALALHVVSHKTFDYYVLCTAPLEILIFSISLFRHFFFTAMLFVYGRILSQRLVNTVTSDKFLYQFVSSLIKYHMVVCYFSYIAGWLWF